MRRQLAVRAIGSRRDDGFTLIELLISSFIIAIIVGPLTAAVITTLRTSTTETRLTESHDQQIAAAYFGRDVESAETFSTSAGCAGVTSFLSIRWTDPVTGDRAVDYISSGGTLRRVACALGGSGSATTLSHAVASVTCVGGCPSATAPRTLQLRVTQTSGRTFTVSGTRRRTT